MVRALTPSSLYYTDCGTYSVKGRQFPTSGRAAGCDHVLHHPGPGCDSVLFASCIPLAPGAAHPRCCPQVVSVCSMFVSSYGNTGREGCCDKSIPTRDLHRLGLYHGPIIVHPLTATLPDVAPPAATSPHSGTHVLPIRKGIGGWQSRPITTTAASARGTTEFESLLSPVAQFVCFARQSGNEAMPWRFGLPAPQYWSSSTRGEAGVEMCQQPRYTILGVLRRT